MQIQGAGGQLTPIEFLTAIPIVIEGEIHHVPALVSRNSYFNDKTILGKKFFAITDLNVRINNDNEWILARNDNQGENILCKPSKKSVKPVHIISCSK